MVAVMSVTHAWLVRREDVLPHFIWRGLGDSRPVSIVTGCSFPYSPQEEGLSWNGGTGWEMPCQLLQRQRQTEGTLSSCVASYPGLATIEPKVGG